ncbi:MAG: flagellin [Alphaproteobacteria bacterium]|nr:flagellin [Alphaproteobacteria bacterium]
MAMTINTNITAMTAQRYLGVNSAKSSSSLAKLSSGSRVPSAKDDAAALAIGSKLRAEVNALQQAGQNASQAVSMLQIADGALSTIGDILVRMKSLATQASSGQLGSTERALLDQEFDSLRNEITRIAADTDFNGTQLLNGGDVVASYNEAELGNLSENGIADITFDTSITADDEVFRVYYDHTNAAQDVGNLTVANLTTGEVQTVDIATLVQAETSETSTDLTTNLSAGETVDVVFDAIGVTLTLDDRFDVDADFNLISSAAVDSTSTAQAEVTGKIAATFLNNGDITGTQLAAITALSNDGLLSLSVDDSTDDTLEFNAVTGLEFSTDGVNFASALDQNDGDLTADEEIDADGTITTNQQQVYIRAAGATDAFLRLDLTATMDVTGSNGATNSTVEIDLSGLLDITESTSTTAQFDFRVGTGSSATNDEIQVTINAVTTAALGISTSDIGDSQSNAETAMGTVTTAINTISSRRADIGAYQSRLEFAASSISVAIENVSAAQSGLLDVDVSREMTEFTSKQVLLQAGISMLAQANQQPALLLRLLQ